MYSPYIVKVSSILMITSSHTFQTDIMMFQDFGKLDYLAITNLNCSKRVYSTRSQYQTLPWNSSVNCTTRRLSQSQISIFPPISTILKKSNMYWFLNKNNFCFFFATLVVVLHTLEIVQTIIIKQTRNFVFV